MPRLISNVPRDYAWGSIRLLAELCGRLPSGRPEAEIWFGDHAADPADLLGGGTLDSVTGGSLPFLLKLLAVAAPLSIQAHPSREQARAGFDAEQHLSLDDPRRSYRDPHHKPELVVALSERFEMLVGLRSPEDAVATLEQLGHGPGVQELRARLERPTAAPELLRETVAWLLGSEAEHVAREMTAELNGMGAESGSSLAALERIAHRHPGDPGVAVAVLMNHITLARGEGLFVPTGTLHGYLEGLGVEVMAASDNVLRGGLTPKRVDVPGLLAALECTPGAPPVVHADERGCYPVPVSDFLLRRRELDGSEQVSGSAPAIILSVSGRVGVDGAQIVPGQAAFVAAEEFPVTVSGRGEIFIAEGGPVRSDTP